MWDRLKLLEAFCKKNAQYWSTIIDKRSKDDGCILVDCQYNHPGVLMTNMYIAKLVQKKMPCKIVALPALKSDDRSREIIGSYNVDHIVNTKTLLMKVVLRRGFTIGNIVRKIRTKKDILSLTIDGVHVGHNLYDAILIRHGVATIKRVTTKIRATLFLELAFFYLYKTLIDTYSFCYGVIGDKEYRYGFLHKIVLRKGVRTISGINGNTMAMRRYDTYEESDLCPRGPTRELIQTVMQNHREKAVAKAETHMKAKMAGIGDQHDVKTAYSSDKLMLNREQLIEYCGLDKTKKTVVIMSHVFPDAPHSQRDMLYDDYYEWLIDTLQVASDVKDVNWLVKPHPSIKFYRCDITVEDILRSQFGGSHIRLVDDRINTASLFESVDAIVTCGGTAGIEFASHGIPVIIASKSNYSGCGFTLDPCNKDQYHEFLRNVGSLTPLSDSAMQTAKVVTYIQNTLFNLDPAEYEILKPYGYSGCELDEAALYQDAVNLIRELERKGCSDFEYLFHSMLDAECPLLVNEKRLYGC